MAVTACTLLGIIYVTNPSRRLVPTQLKGVTGTLFVTSQLKPENIVYLQRRRFIHTIVDIRPDGEEAGQPSHNEIEQAAHEAGMDFYYIPVPHGSIPTDAVRRLSDVLSPKGSGPVVLYCRTGNRALRTLALVEASRPGGPDADAILAAARKVGFSADDLRDEINRRIAERNQPPPDHP